MLNFSQYHPDTEKRIEKLRLLVNKRPVVILLPGGSIAELQPRIEELRGCDICYFGLNQFRGLEEILERIGQQFSVVMNSADPVKFIDSVLHFVSRQEDNLLISERTSFITEKVILSDASFGFKGFDYKDFFEQYNDKLLFFIAVPRNDQIIPNEDEPLHFMAQNSFSILLPLAVIGQASKVFVFGADGGRIGDLDLYFKGYGRGSEGALNQCAETFNETMPTIMDRVCTLYGLNQVDIYNCSVHSNLTPFPRITYDEAFARLKGEYNGNNQTT